MLCRPRLKYHMDYCMEHPEELSRVAGLQKKVDEVKNVMVDNIEQVGGTSALRIACKINEYRTCRKAPAVSWSLTLHAVGPAGPCARRAH